MEVQQPIKEAKFIQTGRSGGGAELGWRGEEMKFGMEGWGGQSQCLHVVDKIWERYLRSNWSQLQVRPHNPGFQSQEDKAPELLVVKTNGYWGGRRNYWFLRRVHLKGPHGLRMYSNPLTLALTAKARAGAPITYGKWVKWLKTGKCQTVTLSPLWALPANRASKHWRGLPCLGEYLSLYYIQLNRFAKTGSQSSST